ncbi:hypothetical protein R3P38DRAFT_2781423 [Favolaschia claudopus]|uniref:Uncharacterized protein n=1 Tax=Favolaschia claudopus TaxID=2862362 RepID=A0AAW0B525_9AGAR
MREGVLRRRQDDVRVSSAERGVFAEVGVERRERMWIEITVSSASRGGIGYASVGSGKRGMAHNDNGREREWVGRRKGVGLLDSGLSRQSRGDILKSVGEGEGGRLFEPGGKHHTRGVGQAMTATGAARMPMGGRNREKRYRSEAA